MWAGLGTLFGAGLLAGGSVLGSILGSNSSDYAAEKAYDAQMRTNELNYDMFLENQRWLTRMANTAHQREVKDLRAAGLNPILSAMGGSGSATPSLATPTAVSPGSSVADKSAIYQGMISSVLQSCNTASDIAKKWGDLEKSMSEKKHIDKVTEKEVGKRQLPAYLHDQITGNAGNLSSAGKQVLGILKDLTRAASNNFNVFKRTLYNDYRTKQQKYNDYSTALRMELE